MEAESRQAEIVGTESADEVANVLPCESQEDDDTGDRVEVRNRMRTIYFSLASDFTAGVRAGCCRVGLYFVLRGSS